MAKPYDQKLADWRARRDANNANVRKVCANRGIPIGQPVRIKAKIGWAVFGNIDIVREWNAIVAENNHGWLEVRPIKRGGFKLDMGPGHPKTWRALQVERVLDCQPLAR